MRRAASLQDRNKRDVRRVSASAEPWEGMMPHQDGSRANWLLAGAALDLIVTVDDATSTIYSAFLVEEEGVPSAPTCSRLRQNGPRARRSGQACPPTT